MANEQKSDAYGKLIRVMLILLVLAVLAGTGYVLVDRLTQAQLDTRAQQVQKQNEELIAQRAQAEAEERAQEQAGAVVVNQEWPKPAQQGWDVVDLSRFAVSGTSSVTAQRADTLFNGLTLINKWHPMPSDYTDTAVVSVGNFTKYRVPVSGSNVRLFPAAVTALDAMVAAAKSEAGLEYYVVEAAYRTQEDQTKFWENKKASLSKKLSGDALDAEASKSVAMPGTSEYQSGFAFVMNVYNKNDTELNKTDFPKTEQGKWMYENSWKYGIVFRFPLDNYPYEGVVGKNYVTGFTIKTDTYRFVGVPHAAAMHALDVCLEEYLDYLVQHPHIAVYEDGSLRYEIFRVRETAGSTTVRIPAKAQSYTMSADNMGGVVIACVY